MYGKELRCLNTKGKYGKVTNTELKWSIISKSVMIIIFVEFIDQLIDFLINRANLTRNHVSCLPLWIWQKNLSSVFILLNFSWNEETFYTMTL